MNMIKGQFDAQNVTRSEERKVDKDEIKATVREETAAIKSKVTELETKVSRVEQADQENKMKFDDMASKFGLLQKEVIELKQNQYANLFPELPARRQVPSILPASQHSNPAIQAEGRIEYEAHPSSQDHIKISHIIKKAKKTVGLRPIHEESIAEAMEELGTTDRKRGLEGAVKDFLLYEMSIPQEVFESLTIHDVFRQPGEEGSENDKLFIEFEEENMAKTIYRYTRKMNKGCGIHNLIPDAFRERANQLENLAYQLRHSSPAYNTKIRWGTCDLILERKLKGDHTAKYKSVTIHNSSLPPVDLHAGPKVRLSTPSTSPAPGRKGRKKRPRSSGSLTSPTIQHKSSRSADIAEDTTLSEEILRTQLAPSAHPPSRLDNGFYPAMDYRNNQGYSLGSDAPSPIITSSHRKNSSSKLASNLDFQ